MSEDFSLQQACHVDIAVCRVLYAFCSFERIFKFVRFELDDRARVFLSRRWLTDKLWGPPSLIGETLLTMDTFYVGKAAGSWSYTLSQRSVSYEWAEHYLRSPTRFPTVVLRHGDNFTTFVNWTVSSLKSGTLPELKNDAKVRAHVFCSWFLN